MPSSALSIDPRHRLKGFSFAGILTGLAATAAVVVLGTLVTAKIAQRGMRQAESTAAGIKSAIAGSLGNFATTDSDDSIRSAAMESVPAPDSAGDGAAEEAPDNLPTAATFRVSPCQVWGPVAQPCGIFWHRRIWNCFPIRPASRRLCRPVWFTPLPRRPR
jgi:hypothetical protein